MVIDWNGGDFGRGKAKESMYRRKKSSVLMVEDYENGKATLKTR